MKKFGIALKILIVSVALLLTFNPVSAKHKIYMLHPTVGYIENLRELIRLELIDIPDLEIVGVYHEKETNDYSRSEKYLKEKGITNFNLMKISGDLDVKTVFGENGCTAAFRQIAGDAGAILFNGGPDIQAAIYGEKQHLLTIVTDPYRHLMETSLFFHLIGGSRNPDFKPLLEQKPGLIVRAFCLGMQTMNVAAGGTLVQDIPGEVYGITTAEDMLALDPANRHHNYQVEISPGYQLAWGMLHPVRTIPGEFLNDLCANTTQQEPWVYSSHHQAVGRMGKNLKVTATSMDGKIVEGLRHAFYNEVIGVQFHPEVASLYQPKASQSETPGQVYSLYNRLTTENSLEFHRRFWKDFSEKVSSLK
jgi:putative glutamine amidotransferase